MADPPIKDADGREAMRLCRAHRQWLVGQYRLGEMIVLRYFSHGTAGTSDNDDAESGAWAHFEECAACRAWISAIVPPSVYLGQSRLARYCCAAMFCAVEEWKERGRPRFEFSMFRGEDPCWKIDDAHSFARYCPWCGKKLPDGPFIPDG